MLLTRNNCGPKTRTSKLADAGSCERLWGTFPESEGREQKSPRTNGRRKAMEPICSTLFSSSLFLSLFPRFSTHRRNLCYLLVTFIWSPRVLDLSLSLLSHSLPILFSFLFFSFCFFRPLSRYRLPTARSLEQSGTSYSGFQTRRQGSVSLLSSSSSSTPFSVAATSPFGSTTWSFLSEIA